MSFYKNKKILVTGGTGMIGRALVEKLLSHGANVVVASLDDASRAPQGVEFQRLDLRDLPNCIAVCKGKDIVFQLAGIKGSPAMAAQKPASFMVPTIQFSVNMMDAAFRAGVERFLFTSSVGVYAPAEVFHEDSVWQTFPSPHDRFAGWAKRIAELQAEAYKIEYGWNNISIVRPANVYGPFDNFDAQNAMVIPSLIRRVCDGENPLVVWGDGTPIRDFIHCNDVADGMMLAVEKNITDPINLGSGSGNSIGEIAQIVAACRPGVECVFDTSKPKGDAIRLMDMTRAHSFGFKAKTPLNQGIAEVYEWYLQNKNMTENRYNAFTEKLK